MSQSRENKQDYTLFQGVQHAYKILLHLSQRFYSSKADILRYRLSPSELNALIYAMLCKLDDTVADGNVNQFHRITRHGKNFVIAPVSKDAFSLTNEPDLIPYIEMVKRYCDSTDLRDCTLVLPVRMCRGYAKAPIELTWLGYKPLDWLKRKHVCWYEIDLRNRQIQVHDSQGGDLQEHYPDKIAESLAALSDVVGLPLKYDPKQNYHAYDAQDDDFSCGIFTLKYIEELIKSGSSDGCKKIGFNELGERVGLGLKKYPSKIEFAREEYGVFLAHQHEDDSDVKEIESRIQEINIRFTPDQQESVLSSPLSDSWCQISTGNPLSGETSRKALSDSKGISSSWQVLLSGSGMSLDEGQEVDTADDNTGEVLSTSPKEDLSMLAFSMFQDAEHSSDSSHDEALSDNVIDKTKPLNKSLG